MAAHEQQHERVVGIDPGLGKNRRRNDERQILGCRGLAIATRDLAADVIGHASERHVNQPAARIVRNTVARPLRGRCDQRFLHGVLAGSEIAEPSHRRAEHLRRQLAQQVLGPTVERRRGHFCSGGPLMTWRTSIGMLKGTPPGPGAADASAASW